MFWERSMSFQYPQGWVGSLTSTEVESDTGKFSIWYRHHSVPTKRGFLKPCLYFFCIIKNRFTFDKIVLLLLDVIVDFSFFLPSFIYWDFLLWIEPSMSLSLSKMTLLLKRRFSRTVSRCLSLVTGVPWMFLFPSFLFLLRLRHSFHISPRDVSRKIISWSFQKDSFFVESTRKSRSLSRSVSVSSLM